MLRRYKDCGEIEAKQRGGYQKPTIQDEHLSIIMSLIEEKNDLLLSELCARFAESTKIRVSITTMYRAVERLAITHLATAGTNPHLPCSQIFWVIPVI
ncbi:MAG: hypothetical protein ACFKPT_12650 [Gloeotrichia echinulata GP01]